MKRRPITTTILGLAVAATVVPGTVRAQTAADSAAIRAAAMDYILGWYGGDADRMARALHPELVKRIHLTDPRSDDSWVDQQGKSRLVAATRSGGGSAAPAAERRADVAILDIFRGAAVARVDAADWVDHLHLVREDGRWLILNVLWELRRPQERTGIH